MRQTVLIVNENVNGRIISETLLLSRGISAITAEDGMEALEIIERNPSVGVLLLDLDDMSPGMSGWELLRQVRRRYEGVRRVNAPKVVVQSERRESETETFVRRLGADAFLRKPTPPEDVLEAVSSYVRPAHLAPVRRHAGRAW